MQKSVQVRTPLYAAAYWQQAADEFKNIRVLAFAGMVTALAIILESFPIYLLGQSLNMRFPIRRPGGSSVPAGAFRRPTGAMPRLLGRRWPPYHVIANKCAIFLRPSGRRGRHSLQIIYSHIINFA